ncbi:SWIM zinc finger family protein [Streptomyces sp. V2]|uniref:SWIM zinc finger family protein n=1 Tax=Streptomyces sp. V2 TaxID=1424099 RepID=UPI001F0C9F4F|nr:SWIM zinc finger family protein [Streptomyces sp. V2]
MAPQSSALPDKPSPGEAPAFADAASTVPGASPRAESVRADDFRTAPQASSWPQPALSGEPDPGLHASLGARSAPVDESDAASHAPSRAQSAPLGEPDSGLHASLGAWSVAVDESDAASHALSWPQPESSGEPAPGPHTPSRPQPPRSGGPWAVPPVSPRTEPGDSSASWEAPHASPGSRPAPADGPSALPHASPAQPATPLRSSTPTSSAPRAAQTPYIPRTMASPSRDGDLRRTFPALPVQGAPFARTWWGEAWVAALEGGALDAARLLRGRGYAEGGRVDAITVTPGSVLAYVQGSRPRPYRVQVRLRTWEADDWERFLGAAVERPGQLAALLDKEVPPALAAECGVPLLPVAGELEPQCSCPDRGHPCKHAAALCYQTARLLDADPFVLLLLRGRGERDLLDTLARRSAAHAARAARNGETEDLPGVRAAEAVARRGQLPLLPAPLPVPPHPEQPPAYPSVPDGPDAFALDQLATDAAARAHALLATGEDPVGELTLWQDAVRLAAARPGSGLTAATRALYSSLAAATGRTPGDLARAVAAWRQGGLDGLAVLEDPWDPPAGRFDRARPLLLATGRPAFRPWRNHLTHPAGHVQLRYGQDGLWYAYESEPGDEDWWPRGAPAYDPVDALSTANPQGEE